MVELVVPPRLKAYAQLLIVHMAEATEGKIRRRKLVDSPPRYLADAVRELRELVDEELRDLASVEREALRNIPAHPVTELALCQPMPSSFAVALLANPPQVTTIRFGKELGCFIQPGSWINTSFITVRLRDGRMHRNLLARFCGSRWRMFFPARRERIFSAAPALRVVYERTLRKEGYYEAQKVLKRDPRNREARARAGRAAALAAKDVLRILLGNAWLTWIWAALDAGIITERDVVLPKELADAPDPRERAKAMIEPRQTFTKQPQTEVIAEAVKSATWLGLVERVSRR